MNRIITLFAVLAILSGCAPTPQQLATPVAATVNAIPTATNYPTSTPYKTLTPYPTYTFYPTYTIPPSQTPKIIIVTPTSSPTPEFTPTNTLPPTATMDPAQSKKSDGFYLVGADIAPGVWKSEGVGDSCYWEITTKTGDIINNHFGMSGGTMYIPSSGFQVQLKECGEWSFMGQ
jgi:hypothetical protein